MREWGMRRVLEGGWGRIWSCCSGCWRGSRDGRWPGCWPGRVGVAGWPPRAGWPGGVGRRRAAGVEGREARARDALCGWIAGLAEEFLAAGDPVISVDAKNKEQGGPYAQAGREWRPAGDPVRVRDHDFPDEDLGKVTPYGVYD